MKVIHREPIQTSKGVVGGTRYKLDTGHFAHIYNYGQPFVYTKTGKYASQNTMHKVFRAIGDFEANRIQIQD